MIDKNDKVNNDSNIFPLTEYIGKYEKNDIYFERLDCIFNKNNPDYNDVFNVAITGGNSTGKSSVIYSYFNTNNIKDVIYIKIPNFQESIRDKENSEEKVQDEKDIVSFIELNFVKQIFYKFTNKEIPNSRFNKIEKIKYTWQFIISFFIIIIALLLAFLHLYDVVDFSSINEKSYEISIYNYKIMIFIGFLILSWATLYIINFLSKPIKVKFFKTRFLDFELKNTCNPFNEFVDELIYIITSNKIKYIVIEDIDRFENISIFEKMRELNVLINGSNYCKDRVFFIYLISDVLFVDPKKKVKFFDYIIPIVPHMTNYNSYEIIKSRIAENSTLKNTENDLYFKRIALDIDDPRILNNIFNEYEIYKDKILECNSEIQIFSLITLKNLYYKEFENLILGDEKSIILSLFNYSDKELSEEGTNYVTYDYNENGIPCHSSDLGKKILLEELHVINSYNIKKTFENIGKEKIKRDIQIYENEKLFDLCYFYVINSHIDRNYQDCLNVFYEGDLNSSDKKLVLEMSRDIVSDYTRKIKSPDKVFEEMKIREIDPSHSTMNIYIIDYLIKENNIKDAIRYLSKLNEETDLYEYLNNYVKCIFDDINVEVLEKRLCALIYVLLFNDYEELVDKAVKKAKEKMEIPEDDNFPRLYNFINSSLCKCDNNVYATLFSNSDIIKKCIANISEENYKLFKQISKEILKNFCKENSFKIIAVKNHENYKYCVDNGNYVFSENNLEVILTHTNFKADQEDLVFNKDEFFNSNFDCIKRKEIIQNKISDNMDNYVKNCFLELKTEQEISCDSLMEILNNIEEEEHIPKIIDKIKKMDIPLEELKEEIIKLLVNKKKINIYLSNIQEIEEKLGVELKLDEVFKENKNFLSNVEDVVYDEYLERYFRVSLKYDLEISKHISSEVDSIRNNFEEYVNDLDINNIDEIIKNGIFVLNEEQIYEYMNQENYQYMMRTYKEKIDAYIHQNNNMLLKMLYFTNEKIFNFDGDNYAFSKDNTIDVNQLFTKICSFDCDIILKLFNDTNILDVYKEIFESYIFKDIVFKLIKEKRILELRNEDSIFECLKVVGMMKDKKITIGFNDVYLNDYFNEKFKRVKTRNKDSYDYKINKLR